MLHGDLLGQVVRRLRRLLLLLLGLRGKGQATGWISLQSKGLSRVFSNTTVQKYQFFVQEEPQTVPEMPGETPPLSPIDMESQEPGLGEPRPALPSF